MNTTRFIIVLASVLFCGRPFVQAQDIDTELGNLAEKLATQIQDHSKKKIAVIDFTDLQGGSTELGKYIAEQLSVNLVIGKRDFTVLDRANLKSILAEHKLTATGLVDPDTAKKLGMFAGVDALILGTITPKTQSIGLTAKIITTDTAEILGAARAQFKTDDNVQQMLSKPTTPVDNAGGSTMGSGSESGNTTAKVVKKLGDLRVELQSLQVINGGKQYALNLTLINQSKTKSVFVALTPGRYGIIRDSNGYDFIMDSGSCVGVVAASAQRFMSVATGADIPPDHFRQATEITPGDTVSVSAKFYSEQARPASSGDCNVQMEILLGNDFSNGSGSCSAKSFTAKITAD